MFISHISSSSQTLDLYPSLFSSAALPAFLFSSSSSLLSRWHPRDFCSCPLHHSPCSVCLPAHCFMNTHKADTTNTQKMTLFNKQATQCVRVRKLLVAPLILLPLKTHETERTACEPECLLWESFTFLTHTHINTQTYSFPLWYTLHPPTWTGCCVKWLDERALTVASVPQTCICAYFYKYIYLCAHKAVHISKRIIEREMHS